MPLVTVTVQRPKTTAFKTMVLDAVHEALVQVGVPAANRFQRVLELEPQDFRFDAGFPDAREPRAADACLNGRSLSGRGLPWASRV